MVVHYKATDNTKQVLKAEIGKQFNTNESWCGNSVKKVVTVVLEPRISLVQLLGQQLEGQQCQLVHP